MYSIVPHLEQGSDEWLEFRATRITATDAGFILGVMPKAWGTAYTKWLDKLFRRKIEVNDAMKRGSEMEPLALEAYCMLKGIQFKPEVVVSALRPWQMASLDGLSRCGKVVELKCPGEKTHAIALSGKVPEYYIPQLQHIMSVLNMPMIDYCSFRDGECVIIQVLRDDEYIENMIKEEEKFYDCLKNVKEPESSEILYEVVSTPIVCDSVNRIKETRQQMATLNEIIDKEKAFISAFADGRNIIVNDTKITKRIRKGNVKYSDIPELKSVDLESYRGLPTEYYTYS